MGVVSAGQPNEFNYQMKPKMVRNNSNSAQTKSVRVRRLTKTNEEVSIQSVTRNKQNLNSSLNNKNSNGVLLNGNGDHKTSPKYRVCKNGYANKKGVSLLAKSTNCPFPRKKGRPSLAELMKRSLTVDSSDDTDEDDHNGGNKNKSNMNGKKFPKKKIPSKVSTVEKSTPTISTRGRGRRLSSPPSKVNNNQIQKSPKNGAKHSNSTSHKSKPENGNEISSKNLKTRNKMNQARKMGRPVLHSNAMHTKSSNTFCPNKSSKSTKPSSSSNQNVNDRNSNGKIVKKVKFKSDCVKIEASTENNNESCRLHESKNNRASKTKSDSNFQSKNKNRLRKSRKATSLVCIRKKKLESSLSLKGILLNYEIYQRYFILYKECRYRHLKSPLFRQNTLSYVYFNRKRFNPNDQAGKTSNQIDIDGGVTGTNTNGVNKLGNNNKENTNKKSVLDGNILIEPLKLDPIEGFKYATLDFFVIRRMKPPSNNMLTSTDPSYNTDSKAFFGTCKIEFIEPNKALFVNTKMSIPLKVLLGSSVSGNVNNHNANITHEEDYRYSLAVAVTYFTNRDNLNLLMMEQGFSGKKCSNSAGGGGGDAAVASTKVPREVKLEINSNVPPPSDKLEFTFDFELDSFSDNDRDTTTTTTNDSNKNREQKKLKRSHFEGEQTNRLMPVNDENRNNFLNEKTSKNLTNIITPLHKWVPIQDIDIFYRSNKVDFNMLFLQNLYLTEDYLNQIKTEEKKYCTFKVTRVAKNKTIDRIGDFSKGDSSHLPKVTVLAHQSFDGKIFESRQTLTEISHMGNPASTGRCRKMSRLQKSSNIPISDKNNPESCGSFIGSVYSKVVYVFRQLQSNTVMNNFSCPFCLLDCELFNNLLVHLKLCHDRFSFVFNREVDNQLIKIDVSINDQYDISYEMNPLENSYLSYGSNRRQGTPVRRISSTQLISYGESRQVANLVQFNCDEKRFIVNLNERVGIAFEENVHKRVFYHSQTCFPILPSELDQNSEDEEYPEWLKEQKNSLIDEFIDVNIGEKEMIKMWNLHINKYRARIIGNCHIPYACELFVKENGEKIIRKQLKYNCVLHLCNLSRLGLISSSLIEKLVVQLNELERCISELSKVSTTCPLPLTSDSTCPSTSTSEQLTATSLQASSDGRPAHLLGEAKKPMSKAMQQKCLKKIKSIAKPSTEDSATTSTMVNTSTSSNSTNQKRSLTNKKSNTITIVGEQASSHLATTSSLS